MMKKNAILRAAAGLALLAAPLLAQPTFHKFVAVGDSLPAGQEGNCTVQRYQVRGASALIAEALGITDFQQPILDEVAATTPPTNYFCLGAVVVNNRIAVGIISQEGAPLNSALARPYDNLGFNGGSRVRDFVDLRVSVPGRSDVDNYAARVLRNVAGSAFEGTNAVEQAASLSPDLMLYWVGNNDVLGAATTGVAMDVVTLTPVPAFEAKYVEGLDTILAAGRTIVTFTIPDVTTIPLFTTLPPIVINPATNLPVIVDGHTVPLLGSRTLPPGCPVAPCPLPGGTLLNTIRASLLMQQGIGIPASLGGLAVEGSGNLATALPDGSFTLPAGPLVQGVLLYPDEVARIVARTSELNGVIEAISAVDGTVLVDLNARFEQVAAEGYHIGGLTLTSAFLSGGLFSADGVHPTQVGYAIIADEIIQRINEETGSEIPRPNIAEAMFTPNVPTVGTSATLPGFAGEDWWSELSVLGAPGPAGLPLVESGRPGTRTVSR
jgi:hypothetical protein